MAMQVGDQKVIARQKKARIGACKQRKYEINNWQGS